MSKASADRQGTHKMADGQRKENASKDAKGGREKTRESGAKSRQEGGEERQGSETKLWK